MDAGRRCFRLCGGQIFSDSEWIRIVVQVEGLVVFGVSLWSCLVSQLDL